jgi:hypothetical protein
MCKGDYMRWTYTVQTESGKKSDSGFIGVFYGDFAGAVEQVASAVRAEGWDKNTVDVIITVKAHKE